jgi:microcystin-dependent protein
MPRNSSGVYVQPASDVNPPIAGTVIDPVAFAAAIVDLGNELTNSLDRLGRAPMQAILGMAGFRIQNLGAPVAQNDAARLADVGSYLPPGAIQDFAMNAAPSGWLVCDGTAYSRTGATANLFAAIGTTWGAGDGSSTFNVPDFRGTIRCTWDNGKGIDPARVFASFQAFTMATHNHTQNSHGHGVADPTHFHGYQSPGGAGQSTTSVATGVSIGAATATNNPITAGIANNNYAILTCIRT